MRLRCLVHLPGLGALLALAVTAGCDDGEEDHPRDRQQSETVTVTAPQRGEVLEIEHGWPEEVLAGQPFQYHLTVRNVSDEAVEGVVIRQRAPADFELIQTSVEPMEEPEDPQEMGGAQRDRRVQREPTAQQPQPDPQDEPTQDEPGQDEPASARGQEQDRGQGRGQDRMIRWRIGALAADQEVSVQITGIAHSKGEHEVCMFVDYDSPVCQTWKVVQPDLRLAIEGAGRAHWLCDGILLTFVLENTGTGTTRPATITADLPEGLTTAEGEHTVTLQVDPLGADETSENEVTLQAARTGTFEIVARAGSENLEVQARKFRLHVVEPELDLEVAAPGNVHVGRPATLRATVTNTGRWAARDVVLHVAETENLGGFELVGGDAEADDGSFALGDLAAGERRVVEIAFRAEEVGKASATVHLEAYCLDEEKARASAHPLAMGVRGVAAVRLEVVDEMDPVPVGSTTTYEVRIKNQGTADGLGLRVVVTLPDTLEFVGADGPTEVRSQDRELRFAPVERLEPGDSVAWEVEARGVKAGDAPMQLKLFSEATGSPVIEEEPTRVVR